MGITLTTFYHTPAPMATLPPITIREGIGTWLDVQQEWDEVGTLFSRRTGSAGSQQSAGSIRL